MDTINRLKRKFKRKPIHIVRAGVQTAFLLFCIFIGFQFLQFYSHFATVGGTPFVERPPAVEGFLPISALMGFKVWIATGEFDQIHPAGLLLFTFFVGTGLLLRRVFCSWICPIGTVSEIFGNLGKKLFKRNFNVPRWITWILIPIKYVLLLFFMKVILFDLPLEYVEYFLNSPYNKVADVKMLLYFLNIGAGSLLFILTMLLLSLFFKSFWCRFLCPYGALIGLGSFLGITRVSRNEETCIDCNQCTKACPQNIMVSKKKQVLTPECTACMQCVEVCPVKETLNVKIGTKKVNKWTIPALFFVLFFAMVGFAKLTGNWETVITYDEFRTLIPYADQIGF